MLIHDIIGIFSHRLAIDLGTSRARVALRDSGRSVEMPSAICINSSTGRPLLGRAVLGDAAERLTGRAPPGIEIVRPVRRGVVADPRAASDLLSAMIGRAHGRRWAVRPTAIASYPAGATAAEKEGLLRALVGAGVRKACLIDNLTAAVAGSTAGSDTRCHLVADLGAGKINFGALRVAGGGLSASVGFGGEDLARAVARSLWDDCSIDVTADDAQDLLARVGLPDPADRLTVVDRPGTREEISPVHIAAALRPYLEQLKSALAELIREARSPDEGGEFAAELSLVGGLARVPGLAAWLSTAVGVPVRVPPEPQGAVIRGLGALSVGAAGAAAWVRA